MFKSKMLTAALVVVGTFSMGYTAVAQPGSMMTQSNTRLSAMDKQFMLKAAQGGMAEVQFGQIAIRKASSAIVRQYAQRMINEHTPVNQQLMALAARKGVALPKTIGAKNLAVKRQLSNLSGPAFDQAYITAAGVQGHTEQAELFQSEIQSGSDPAVKAFANRVIPTVEGHLQMARAMTAGTATGRNMMPMSQPTGSGGMNMMHN